MPEISYGVVTLSKEKHLLVRTKTGRSKIPTYCSMGEFRSLATVEFVAQVLNNHGEDDIRKIRETEFENMLREQVIKGGAQKVGF